MVNKHFRKHRKKYWTATLFITSLFLISVILGVFNAETSEEAAAIERVTISKITQLSPTECNDGIDNDGDGLVDWQYDLGCYDSNDNSEGGKNNVLENGWTVFEPSSDTMIVYVSSSTGSDSYDGLSGEWNGTSGPKATIASAYTVFCPPKSQWDSSCKRDGYPDWLLLKRGDSWDLNGSRFGSPSGWWLKNGRSLDYPVIVSTYGNLTSRAQVINGGWSNAQSTGSVNYLAIIGIEFYRKDHDPNGGSFTNPNTCPGAYNRLKLGDGMLFEDDWFRFSAIVIDIPDNQTLNHLTMRRSIITDSYTNGSSHCQGDFLKHLNNTLFDEVLADANGLYAPDGETGLGGFLKDICVGGNPEYYIRAELISDSNINIESSKEESLMLKVSKAVAECGNGIKEFGETCDSNSQKCMDSQNYQGTQDCNAQCDGWMLCQPTESCGTE